MKPIEFITDIGQYNSPFGEEMEARTLRDIKIRDTFQEYRVLSYYYNEDARCMVLDIEEIK